MRILIVDDESSPRHTLKDYLTRYDPNLEIEEAEDGFTAIEKVSNLHPDIVFLDISMPGLSGFDVLCHFPERSFQVVFQTAHDDFAVRAFEESAIDYLLKPYSYNRFEKSMKKIQTNRGQNVDAVREKLAQQGITVQSIVVDCGNKSKAIAVNDIIYFCTESRAVKLITNQVDYFCDLRLNDLEQRLAQNFMRVHRGFLVNISKVASAKFERGSTKLIMNNGDTIAVSREMRKTAKKLFGDQA